MPKFFIRKITVEYGLWNQIRVDKGREWSLMLFIQDNHRNDTRKPSYMQTSSKQVRIVVSLTLTS